MSSRPVVRFGRALPLLAALVTPAIGQELPEAGWLAGQTAQDDRAAARFPAHVQPLAADAIDPIPDERTPTPITVAPRGTEGASLTVWPREVAFGRAAADRALRRDPAAHRRADRRRGDR